MRVLLAGPEQEENLSLRYLASSLLAGGHAVEIASFCSPADGPGIAVRATEFDALGLSMVFERRAREFLSLARGWKDAGGGIVIAGGHHATLTAAELLDHHPDLDVVVLHEGERTLVELADVGFDRHRFGDIDGITYRDATGTVIRTAPRPMTTDLESLPRPDRRGPVGLMAGVPTSYVLGSRGRLYRCSYCCISTLHDQVRGPKLRRRGADDVADEMAELYHRRGIRQFVFHDDNFLVPSARKNHRRLAGLRRGLERRGVGRIGLTIKSRPADADAAILDRLVEMGLTRLFLGIESGSQAGLDELQRRQQLADGEACLGRCRDRGISAQYTLLMFRPSATADSLRDDIAFFRRHLRHPLNFTRAELYAGTPLLERMAAAGRAFGDYLGHSYHLEDPVADLACTHAARLLRERCWVGGGLTERVIGGDYLAATARRFYDGPDIEAAARAVEDWRDAASRELVDLLERLVGECADDGGSNSPALRAALELLAADERRGRERLLVDGAATLERLEALCLRQVGFGRDGSPVVRSRSALRLASHAAAVLLALSTSGLALNCIGVSEYAPDISEIPPDINITSPNHGNTFEAGVPFTFVAEVTDNVDDSSDLVVSLESSAEGTLVLPPVSNGVIDTELTLTVVGEHTLTLRAEDTDGNTNERVVEIQIEPASGDDDSV